MTGSLGTLGVLLEVSLKVLPVPPSETTLHLKQGEAEAIALMNRWAAQPLPITATAWCDGNLGVRLSGATPAVDAAVGKIGVRSWIPHRPHASGPPSASIWTPFLPPQRRCGVCP